MYRSAEPQPEPPQPAPEAWTVSLSLPPAGAVVTSLRPIREERPNRGWFESGLYVMTMPVVIGVGVMLAPVMWMLRSRSRP